MLYAYALDLQYIHLRDYGAQIRQDLSPHYLSAM